MPVAEKVIEQYRHFRVGATKNTLDDFIDRHAEAYLDTYPEVKEFSNFEKSGTGNYYIGMVWSNDYEKVDTKPLKIRGSSSMTDNKTLELDLSALHSPHLIFPGQIIAFLADPYTQRQLTVRRILDPMRIAPHMKSIHSDEIIKLVIASGPFIKHDQTDWTLFDKVLENVKILEATHVILIGPFVSLDNKALGAKYVESWHDCFAKISEKLYDHPCKVYMIPSNRDIIYDSLGSAYVMPSPPIKPKQMLKHSIQAKFTIVPSTDPAQIDLGGNIHLDVTSAEVLFHFNKCSTFVNKGDSNLFNAMYRHMLTQGIYPIYPPPSDMAIDYPKLSKYTQLDRLGAHILVMPTRFNTSVSNVDNRLVIAVQKCSTKKQLVYVEIPRIDSGDQPIDSIVITDYKNKIIDLQPQSD